MITDAKQMNRDQVMAYMKAIDTETHKTTLLIRGMKAKGAD